MTKLEKVIHTARAHAAGGRDNGASRTSNGRLDVRLSVPGKAGTGTNPEQLFAVGWSACFLSALGIAASKSRVALPAKVTIDIEFDLGVEQGVHCLATRLNVSLPGVEHGTAPALVEAVHKSCPYSLATQGNIEVITSLVASQPIHETETVHQ